MVPMTKLQQLWAKASIIARTCPEIRKRAFLRMMEILVQYPDVDSIDKYLYEFDKDPRGPSRSEAYLYYVREKLKKVSLDEWLNDPYGHFDHFERLISDAIKGKPYQFEAILELAQVCKKYGPHDLAEWARAIDTIFRMFLNLEWHPQEPLLHTYYDTDDPTYESESLGRFHQILNEFIDIKKS